MQALRCARGDKTAIAAQSPDARPEHSLVFTRRAAIAAALANTPQLGIAIPFSVQRSPEWRASTYLRMAGDVRLDRLDFASRGEREWSRLMRLRVLASASPQLSVTSVLQLNDQADLFNVRVRYNVREGHDLWVVYGHQMNTERDRTTPAMPVVARVALLLNYARSFGE